MNSLDVRMIMLTVQLIRAGRRKLEEVPEHLRADVETALSAADQPMGGE